MKAIKPSPGVSVHLECWLFLLIVSVREVFQTMLATKVAPVFEPAKGLYLEWTAMVGLAGELRGVLMFSCDEKSAVRITSKMLGVPLPGPDEQTADTRGEVCNRIAGSGKPKVNGLSERCPLSPPTVVTGKDYRVHRQEFESLHSLSVTFTFDGAPIYLSLELLK